MSEDVLVCGIDLGGTNFQIGVVDADGEIVGRNAGRTHAEEGPDEVIRRLSEGVREACSFAGVRVEELGGLGVGAPGAIDQSRGVVLTAPNLGWSNEPLGEKLSRELGGVRTVIDNDVTLAVFGEQAVGAGRGESDLLGVWVGTGVGGGLVLNGTVYQGPLGTAGEIGHTVLFPDAAPGRDRLEHHCSRSAVQRVLAERIAAGSASELAQQAEERGWEEIRSGRISDAFRNGDELAVEVVQRAADLLGTGIANVLSVLGVDAVVLGGGLTEALGGAYVERVANSARKTVFPPSVAERLRFMETELRENAGLLGAAMWARRVG